MKVDTLRPELKVKIQEWISSFYHLDPRYKILTFFNLVATEGADNVIDDSINDDYPTTTSIASNQHSNTVTAISEQHTSNIQYSQSSPNIPAVRSNSIKSIASEETYTDPGAGDAPPLSYRGAALLESRPSARNISPWMLDLLGKIFNATSILTVWRPCSNDAMRKMMEGTGVGKGLDIKGKSAKKGILSAFVPFLQIFKQDHMNEIQPIAVGANMRVYYKDEKMRDYVLTVLEDFLVNGPKKCTWKKKKKKTKSIVGTSTTTTTTTTATTKKECCTTEEVEFVDMIEGNNDLSQSKKTALEDAAADIFGGEHTEEELSPSLKEEEIRRSTAAAAATTKEAIAYMAEDVNVNHNNPEHQEQQERDNRSSGIHSTRFYEKYNLSSSTHSSTRLSPQQEEEAAHAATCVTHGERCENPTVQSHQSGAVRASTSGEERVEAAMIAAEQAVAFADREAAKAAKRLSSGTSTLKAEAVVASAKIKAAKLKEEAVAAAAKVVAVVAAAATQAHTAAAYENPFGADDDDCGQKTDEEEDVKKEEDDDDNNADADADDSDSECDGDGDDDVDNMYVGNFDHKDQNSSRYCPVKPLKKIKKFAKSGYYGIECSQRLFWFATVQDACIERKGTGTETGRPSLPGFQDANMKTLKAATAQIPKPSPMPVLLQHHSYEDCLNVNKSNRTTTENDDGDGDGIVHHTAKNYTPLQEALDPIYLVMAYEEQGTVKPVVSDFDGFLLGWRREALTFGCNLPRDQENLMLWCVDHIEEVLEGQRQNPTNGDTWTIRWLDILKKEAARGFHVEMPEYGFGDPKSTSIMEHAANRLKSTGAVRHGSECFNYQFPQEIDDMFLLISDTLKPVPFKYVAVEELQEILRKKIQEGFVFPLNPKWILCDPGWKTVYDELMATDSLYSDLSKDVWFPPHTGIRRRLEEVCQKYPEGFSRCTDPSKATCGNKSPTDALRDSGLGSTLTGNAAADLAQMELDDYTVEVKDKKLRASTRFVGATGHKATLSMTMEDLKECPEEEEKIYIDSNGSIKNSTTSNASSTTISTSKKGISWGESIRKSGESKSHSNHNSGGGNGGRSRKERPRRGSGVSQHSQNSSVSSSGTINTLSNTTKDATVPAEATCNTTPKGLRRVFMSTRKLFHRAQQHHKNSSASSNPDARRRKSSEEQRSSKASRTPHTIHGGDVIIDLAGASSAPSLSSAEKGNTSRSTRNHHFSLNQHKKEQGARKK